MTLFDLQPIDPYEARFRVIATLFLLSELGVIEDREAHSKNTRPKDPARSLPSKRTAHGGSRLVRPPRSC
jgi:hypothetical protein